MRGAGRAGGCLRSIEGGAAAALLGLAIGAATAFPQAAAGASPGSAPGGTGSAPGAPQTACPAAGNGSCSLNQRIAVAVVGDPTGLELAPEAQGGVTMTPVTAQGPVRASTGRLPPLELVDARGTLTGWSVVAHLVHGEFATTTGDRGRAHAFPVSDFLLGGTGGAPPPQISCAANSGPPLHEPSCIVHEVTQPDPGVPVGGPSGPETGLGFAANGGGGGSFVLRSGLSMEVPQGVAPGTYGDALAITMTSCRSRAASKGRVDIAPCQGEIARTAQIPVTVTVR